MAVAVGDKLGPYEILAPIGAGGMGEVFRARDTRLGREVAIKVSNARFSERFEREARAIAALNHPNICQLYDVGPNYLVMELIEGESPEGPLPLATALHYARQIADALEAAHEKGITHRDLKPANIKIKAGGVVKVLDFGLAKVAPASAGESDTDFSATFPLTVTQPGVIMGTPAYMSPEQARGQPIDKRADIWAFGVVLYEMLTGKRPFKGRDLGETLAAVIKEEPNLEQAPARVRRLLRLCLQKDPNRRLHDVADAWLLLDDVRAGHVPPERANHGRPLPWIAAVVLGVAAFALGFIHFREKPPVASPVRFQVPMPEKVTLGGGGFSLSPDGRLLVFVAVGSDGTRRIFVRALDSLEARPLPGTEGASLFPPFWSPDSKFVGFAIGNKYMKVDVSGGPPQTLCELPGIVGTGAWNRDGAILVNSNPGGLYQVPEAGGVPTPVTALDPARKEQFHVRSSFLPDGRHFLYLRFSSNPEYTGTYIGSLDVKPQDQDRRRLLPGLFGVLYVPSSDPAFGHVLFVRGSTLMAQPFDARKLELTGQPVPVVEQVGNNGTLAAFFWASESGALAFRGGAQTNLQLTWLDRSGTVSSRVGDPAPYSDLALSPDGTRVASFHADAQFDIWLYEFARGVSTRFTFAPSVERYPVWSPDRSRIVFASNRGGHFDLYWKASDGTGEDELLFKSDQDKIPTSWSRDGRFLLFTSIDPKTSDDIWVLPLEGDPKPLPFLRTEFYERQGSFSPDGRWVAYTSTESGEFEIYVRPFSPPDAAASSSAGGKWQISKAGGREPLWRGDSKELFYVATDGKAMAIEVTANPAFQAGIPQPLFNVAPNASNLQVTPDGKRFLTAAPPQQASAEIPITVLLNWQALLKK